MIRRLVALVVAVPLVLALVFLLGPVGVARRIGRWLDRMVPPE